MQYSIFHIEGGIGKNIVATNLARVIKKSYPERELVVVTPYPEVFLHNPHVYRIYKTGMCPYFYEDYIKDKDTLIFKQEPYSTSDVINRKKSLAEAWCACNNLKLDLNKPELFFNQIEQQNALLLSQKYSNNKPMIALQVSGGAGVSNNHINFNWFRDLPSQYIQPLIKEFEKDFNFVQIRHSGQLIIDGATQIDLTIREVLLFLSQVRGAVCIDSVVQHVMACYNKPSIVCWIGNSSKVFGYNLHTNIESNLKIQTQNLESYLDSYPLQTQGHQCPSEYNFEKLFSYDKIRSEFIKMYIKNS